MLNPGKYRAHAVSATLGTAGTGKEQVAVVFEIIDPPGERITWWGYFTEKTLDRTMESLRRCGWRGDDLSVFAEGEPLPADMTTEVELDVQHETYKDQVQVRVVWVNAAGGPTVKSSMSKAAAQAFAAKLRRPIQALDKASGRAVAPPAKKPPPRPPPPVNETPLDVLDGQAEAAPNEDAPW